MTEPNGGTPAQIQISQLYWEDLEVGLREVGPGRTVSEADLVTFAGLSGDYNQIHMDAEFATERGLGGERLVHGLLGLTIASGLFTRTAMGSGMQRQLIAMLSVNWDFKGPLRIGDTVRIEATISGRRETSRPDRGITEIDRELINQRGEKVQVGDTTMMLRRRPALTSPETA